MRLRKLEMKDAPYMFEWMQDASIVEYMDTDFLSRTLMDCERFISEGQDGSSIHRAVVDSNDVYMGTVSLKHIDPIRHCAEFAIVVRQKAMGKGYSKFAMNEMIKIGFEKLQLEKIYWYVSKLNERANRFYKKNGYSIETNPQNVIGGYNKEKNLLYYWYLVEKAE